MIALVLSVFLPQWNNLLKLLCWQVLIIFLVLKMYLLLPLFEKNSRLRIGVWFFDGDVGLRQKYLLIPHQIIQKMSSVLGF